MKPKSADKIVNLLIHQGKVFYVSAAMAFLILNLVIVLLFLLKKISPSFFFLQLFAVNILLLVILFIGSIIVFGQMLLWEKQ